jgi:hypothetical protein
VSDRMEAHLAGLGFEVEPLTPEVQAISTVRPTKWNWDIEPTQVGHAASDPDRLGFDPRARRIHALVVQTFEKKLTIQVTLYERAKRFVSENWLWLAVGAPIASVLYARYKRGKRTRRRVHRPRRSLGRLLAPRPSPGGRRRRRSETEEAILLSDQLLTGQRIPNTFGPQRR